jgi:hypothetical protein
MEFSSLKDSNTNEIYEVSFPLFCSRLLTDFRCGRTVYRSPGKPCSSTSASRSSTFQTGHRRAISECMNLEYNGLELANFFPVKLGVFGSTRGVSVQRYRPHCVIHRITS